MPQQWHCGDGAVMVPNDGVNLGLKLPMVRGGIEGSRWHFDIIIRTVLPVTLAHCCDRWVLKLRAGGQTSASSVGFANKHRS